MTYDLAIVGGGILGCLTAAEMVRRNPGWRGMLLEARQIASGATAWSAAVNFPLAATPAHRELVLASEERWAELKLTPAGRFIRPLQMLYVLAARDAAAFPARVVASRAGGDDGGAPAAP